MFNRVKISAKASILATVLLLANVTISLAQVVSGGTGQQALATTATTIRGYGTATQQIVMALGLIIGFVGAIRVYGKWHNGDPDTQKAAIGWFGAALFLVAVGAVLAAFFGA
ncbi:DUF4134 domain-containing protein [Nibrella saemangeumensis]|uniref:DUF4134 domain-containing protein n=1 Tax=Nibrella saemangeumensis TaxID=1084526 RepID=A0ABP8NG54_9BACT